MSQSFVPLVVWDCCCVYCAELVEFLEEYLCLFARVVGGYPVIIDGFRHEEGDNPFPVMLLTKDHIFV